MDAPAQLNRLLQRTLRQSIPFEYQMVPIPLTPEGSFRCRLSLNGVGYVGALSASADLARQSAARAAVQVLTQHVGDEPMLRFVRRLPPRPRMDDVDRIRDRLRDLRHRSRQLPNADRTRAEREVLGLYAAVDRLEEIFVQNNLAELM